MRVLGLRTGRGQERDWISVRGSYGRSQEVASEWCCISSRAYMDPVMPIPTPKFWLTALYFNVPSSPFFSYYFAILSVQIKYTLVIRPWGWWTRQTGILWPQLRAKSWYSCPNVDSPIGWLGPVTDLQDLGSCQQPVSPLASGSQELIFNWRKEPHGD